MHVNPIYNTAFTQNETPYPNQSSVKGPFKSTINTYKKNSDITRNIPNDSMATTPTRQKTLNNIRNHSIHTISTEIQPLLKQNKTILDKQYILIKIIS